MKTSDIAELTLALTPPVTVRGSPHHCHDQARTKPPPRLTTTSPRPAACRDLAGTTSPVPLAWQAEIGGKSAGRYSPPARRILEISYTDR